MAKGKLTGCLPELSANGDFYNSEDVEVIVQSIYVILTTPRETRVWQPEFGCDLMKYLWDPLDETTLENIETDITSALETWEPRIVISNVYVKEVASGSNTSSGTVSIQINFTFDRKDYSHTFVVGADTDLMNLSIYNLKIDKQIDAKY